MSSYPRDSFRALRRYTPDRRPVDIDLSDNTNLWGAHPDAVAVVTSSEAGAVSNYPSVYSDDLREAVSAKFGVSADCVVTGCGSGDVLDSAFRAACEPGVRVAFPTPTFLMVPHYLVLNGLEAVPLGDAVQPPSPGELLGAGADLIYVCNPNNPTGTALTRAWVDELIDGVGDGPVLILDEAYLEFAEASAVHVGEPSLLDRALASPRVLLARTFSKAYGLAGLRVGYGIANPELAVEIDKARGPYKVAPIAERAAAAALRDESGWLGPTVEDTVRCRDRLLESLKSHGANPLPSSANFIMLPVPVPAVDAAADFRARGISVRSFSNVPGLGEALRITVGPLPVVERLVATWEELSEYWGGEMEASG